MALEQGVCVCVGRERAGFLTLSLASSKVHINNEAWEKEKREQIAYSDNSIKNTVRWAEMA